MTEVVYLIGASGMPLAKIGRTKDPQGRLRSIQRMSPVQLEIRWQTDGGSALETHLHRRFKALRTHGEWFDFGDKDPVAEVEAAAQAMGAHLVGHEPDRHIKTWRTFASGTPAGELADALVCLDANPDALCRWAEAGEMTDAVRDATSRVGQIRQGVVRELRDQGMTYRAIGEMLGVHFTRVKQLADGEPATRWKKSEVTPETTAPED